MIYFINCVVIVLVYLRSAWQIFAGNASGYGTDSIIEVSDILVLDELMNGLDKIL